MIFVDSNVPMYLVGAEHPNKDEARRLLERVIVDNEPLATDAEVFQEILHRYVSIDRRDAIPAAFEALLGVVDVVLPMEIEDVGRARRVLERVEKLSARDALHVAVMQRHKLDRILSFDAGFDTVPGIQRVAG